MDENISKNNIIEVIDERLAEVEAQEKFIKAQLNTKRLTPLQWDGILRAMDNYAKYYHEKQTICSCKTNNYGYGSVVRCYTCGKIKDIKVEKETCKICKGKGYILPDPIHSIDCSACKGTGEIIKLKSWLKKK